MLLQEALLPLQVELPQELVLLLVQLSHLPQYKQLQSPLGALPQ